MANKPVRDKRPGRSWEDYLGAPISREGFESCRSLYGTALKDQRDMLQGLYDACHPSRIACLGAGFLNDIPIAAFVGDGREIYLVDWVPDISREGFMGSIISQENNRYACLICSEDCGPERFCSAFRTPIRAPYRVCDNFVADGGSSLRCGGYHPGPEPYFLEADITLGRASAFAEDLADLVETAKSPRQAFQKAIAKSRRCASTAEEIAVESDSIDLVTSSMVMSQFDKEPYAYFSKLLARRFGTELLIENEERLLPMMEELRAGLFRVQAEGLAREMHRIVNKEHGRAYLSVELFRSLPDRDGYFLVQEIPAALEVLGDYFHFDFDLLPPGESLRPFSQGEDPAAGKSLVQCLVMTPIAD